MKRAGIALLALAPRLALAYVTLGSVDIINDARNTIRLFAGLQSVQPYLPGGIDLLLWIGGVAAFRTAIPLAFAYKFFPLLADAAIAVLLGQRDARRGVLYALAPVPILICAVHGQWDALFLCPLLLAVMIADERPLPAGIAVALSIIAKPIAGPLIPLFFTRDKKHALRFAGGLAIAGVAYIALMAMTKHPLTIDTVKGIVRYAGGGVQLFGLPYRPPRLWTLAPIPLLFALQWRGRVTRAESMLIFFAITLGLSGLAPQYLCWIVPFALLCGRMRFHALYTAVAGAFLILYYQSPFLNLSNIENLGTFAFLRPLGFLEPPMPGPGVRVAAQLLGNVLLPLLCLAFAAWWLWRPEPEPAPQPGLTAPLAVLAVITLCSVLRLHSAPSNFAEKIKQYDAVLYHGPGLTDPRQNAWIARSFVDPHVANPIVNASTLGFLAVAAAAIHALGALQKREQ